MDESPQQMIPRPQTDHDPDDSFYAVAERYLDDMMRLNPFVSTYLGYHKYDRLMDDMSSPGIANKIAFYEISQRRFDHIDAAPLSPSVVKHASPRMT